MNPGCEDVFYYLGVYSFQNGEFETAKSYYQQSLSINNDQLETKLNLGVLCNGLIEYLK
ncbi:tetratricopeptide repeat protein [Paenibacillus konkukensis]|uniref:tetratricopeptide repeat protein n=1 Tax=Paenibacillus konkukensis TaxID=2020716 RepID=UPI003D9BED78